MPAHPSLTHPDLLLADFVPRLEKADRIKFWPLSALVTAYMIETLTGSYQILDVIILCKGYLTNAFYSNLIYENHHHTHTTFVGMIKMPGQLV